MLHVVASSTAVSCKMCGGTRSQPPPPWKERAASLGDQLPHVRSTWFFFSAQFPLLMPFWSSPPSPAKAACVLTVFSFFPLLMLPFKETNSSEESECDDLDPNTSMEVEAAIVVLLAIMIVFLNVFYNSDLAEVTGRSRINVRASLGVPCQLKNKTKQKTLIQLSFYRNLD